MHAIIWIVTGMLAGSAARFITRRTSYGWTGDLVLGILGGFVGGWLLRIAGVSAPDDTVRQFAVSLVGAIVVLGIAHALLPSPPGQQTASAQSATGFSLESHLKRLGEFERQVFERVLRRYPPRDPNAAFDAQLTFGQRVADDVARFGGSWNFIGIFLLLMVIWIAANTETRVRFDPYPFILLNLVLSCLAALQAPVIMMSQNRMAVRDRLEARTDYEVNLRAEVEIQRLHEKLDAHNDKAWGELVRMQREQIELLQGIILQLRQTPSQGDS